jgi:DNA polymerase-1
MPELLYVIDVYSLVFQVFHAIPEMTGPTGQPTNAVFGFVRDMLSVIQKRSPTHLICGIDSPGPGIRETTIDPQYKEHRTPMPEALRPQIPMICEVISALGTPLLSLPGWEADDVIATVVAQAASRDMDVVIVSGDKDVRQLLSPRVRIFNMRKLTFFTEAELLQDWGVRPDQVVDFQSLVGDSVDNVKGVPLVGPKKAAALLQEFGTLDAILANADKAPGARLRENLKTYADAALRGRKLVTLYRDLPLSVDWEAARVGRWDIDQLDSLCTKLGFRRFKTEVRSLPPAIGPSLSPPLLPAFRRTVTAEEFAANDVPSETPPTAVSRTEDPPVAPPPAPPAGPIRIEWTVVDTREKLAAFVEELASRTEFCLDLETTSLDPMRADIVGWAISWELRRGWYIPVRGPTSATVLPPDEVIAALRPILENPRIAVTNQNIKYDLLVLRRAGVHVASLGVDPMVCSYLLDAGARTHSLDDMALRRLQHQMIPISQLIGTGLFQKRMDEVPVEEVAEYSVEDAAIAWELAGQFRHELKSAGLWDLYWNLERPLIDVLVEMQFNGIRVNPDLLREQGSDIADRLRIVKAEIFELAGREFNIDSPIQLRQILFVEQGLPVLRKTKTGPSTDQEVLEELAAMHPLPAKILDHRRLGKLKSTYLDSLPGMIHPETGRIHTSFNQVVAATGRLSSSEPNLQNIPIRTEEGRRVRAAFVAESSDWVLLCADYSQIELRMLAHFCGDAALRTAFEKGVDIHAAVAGEVFGLDPDAVTSEQRRMAKAVNFGVIYGQSPFGLAASLGISRDAATRFIDDYFRKYSGVDAFFTGLLKETVSTGYARTILGRRRAIEGIVNVTGRQRNLPERTAINTVIQGSAADLIKQAMVNVLARLRRERHPARMLLQIHDELVFETPRNRVDDLRELVRHEMENALPLSVPIKVDISVGDDWLNTN